MTDSFHNNLINHSLAILSAGSIVVGNRDPTSKSINKIEDKSFPETRDTSEYHNTYFYDIATNCCT